MINQEASKLTWREKAIDRVKSELLQPYEDILIDRDWETNF